MSGPVHPLWVLALCFIENAGIAFLAIRLLYRDSDPRLLGIVSTGVGIVGAVNFMNGIPFVPGLIVVWIICASYAVAVCYDVQTRRIPPLMVVPAAAVLALIDVLRGDMNAFVTGLVIGGLFYGLSFLRTKDVKAGVGDSVLAGIAGLAFGFELGLIVVAIACFVSAAFAYNKQGQGAIVFAPYLAATVGIALLIPGR
jgi:prepilin signal peptidase PulO-like enzyme (type II secretory pathway)